MKWLERLFASRTARLGIVLATLPLKTLTELGFTIAFGVLLDTFLVRSVLVPALVFDMGARVWWPSALARHRQSMRLKDAEIAARTRGRSRA